MFEMFSLHLIFYFTFHFRLPICRFGKKAIGILEMGKDKNNMYDIEKTRIRHKKYYEKHRKERILYNKIYEKKRLEKEAF